MLNKSYNYRSYPITAVLGVLLLFGGCTGMNAEQNAKVAEAKREIGEAYMRQGDYTSALRELMQAEKLNPEDPIVQNDLGLCYMAKEHMADALAHFNKAIALNPSYAPARNNLGTAYLALKEWDAAIKVFKEITKDILYASPHYPLTNLGLAYYHKGQYQTALKYYKEALKLQEDFVIALRGAGRTYIAMNQGKSALRYLKRAVKLAPKSAETHFDIAEAYLLTGNPVQAKISYESAIDLSAPESDIAAKAKQRLKSFR